MTTPTQTTTTTAKPARKPRTATPAKTAKPTTVKKPATKPPAKATPAKKPEQPKTEVAAKPSKQDAKQDLGRRCVLALDTMIAALDGSEACLSGMTRKEVAECVSQWIHHFPTGREDGNRSWPATTLPKPDRSDWR